MPSESPSSNIRRGAFHALLAAVLFGIGVPLSKPLTVQMDPLWLSGAISLGYGIGLGALLLWRRAAGRRSGEARRGDRSHGLSRTDAGWLAGAIAAGGTAPLLLAKGLQTTPAASASMLLNLEGAFTAGLAWMVFGERFSMRILLGIGCVLTGGVLLSLEERGTHAVPVAALLVAGACFLWGMDNNLTRKISGLDPVFITAVKGLAAGSICTLLGAWMAPAPAWSLLGAAALLGLVCYGLALTSFILALRHLGAARTAAFFSTAPFVGAAVSGFMGAIPSGWFWAAAACMAAGVWLNLTDKGAA